MESNRLQNLMNATTLLINDQVDQVLHKIVLAKNLTLNLRDLYGVTIMDQATYRLDHLMLEKGLLKISGEERTITAKGLEIVNFGGWASYQNQLRKEKPRNIYGVETLQFKYESEIATLRREIQRYKNDGQSRAEKEVEASRVISSLIEQNRSSKLMFFVAGIAVGVFVASVLSYLLF